MLAHHIQNFLRQGSAVPLQPLPSGHPLDPSTANTFASSKQFQPKIFANFSKSMKWIHCQNKKRITMIMNINLNWSSTLTFSFRIFQSNHTPSYFVDWLMILYFWTFKGGVLTLLGVIPVKNDKLTQFAAPSLLRVGLDFFPWWK